MRVSGSEIPVPKTLARWLLTIVCARSPVARADLGHVLEDAQQLHPLAGAGRGDLVEVRDRGDVRALVEDQQQRRVDRLARSRPTVS